MSGKIAGIYKITSPSGSIYIGQSKDIEHRFYRYRTAQCKKQPALYAAIMKYGSDNLLFEIIHELPIDVDRNEMDSLEELYIQQYKECRFRLLNLTGGGKTNKELSDDTRRRLSESAKGKKYWLGRKHTPEAKEKIRKANTGVVFTEERLRNMSESLKGKPSPNKGKKMSQESKDKIRKARTGVKLSEEHRKKISEGLQRRKAA